ncbi:hypothetical protein [Corynebacterium sp. A21]|uniref:hypothetical protein n=1 Tax=Corynebacterium sp. A21 TaxID=3457318 RepID=UPI003FD63D51
MMTPIAQLKFYPGNARRGDVDLIAESLKVNGQYKPIVAANGGKAPEMAGVVIAGNHTLMAAQRLGWAEIDVHWVDVDPDEARRIVLVDNRSNDASTYDTEELLKLLTDWPDLDGTGFTRDEVDALLDAMDSIGEEPEPEPEPVTSFGLLIELESKADMTRLKTELIGRGYTVGEA